MKKLIICAIIAMASISAFAQNADFSDDHPGISAITTHLS